MRAVAQGRKSQLPRYELSAYEMSIRKLTTNDRNHVEKQPEGPMSAQILPFPGSDTGGQ